MEATAVQDTIRGDLTRELDNLTERVDMAATLIAQLRSERSEARAQCESLERERQRILEAAGVSDAADLLRALDRFQELAEENRQLREEREEVARRLAGLIEKVDLLERDS